MTDVDGMAGLLALGALAASVMTASVLSVGAMMRTSLGTGQRDLSRAGLLHGLVTSDLRRCVSALEGCAPCPSRSPRSFART